MPDLIYADIRDQISDGDLLLWRPTSLLGRAISVASRSVYSHSAMAVWWHGQLMHLDMVSSGGRAETLSSQVERYSGKIDWFRANRLRVNWDTHATIIAMIRTAGQPYGTWSLIRNMLSYSVVTRWLVRPNDNDIRNGYEVCSQAVSNAYRAGGVDPVLGLADMWTSPGDLAHSLFFEEMGTLV